MKYIKKGAMFGLDARIALAIFGALSVISGAALYSAIQDAKATSVLAQMTEVGKAYDQYFLDTGSELGFSNGLDRDIDGFLADNYVAGWKGPYLSIEDVGFLGSDIAGRINTSDGKKIFIRCLRSDVAFGGLSDNTNTAACVAGNNSSSNWILYEAFPKVVVDRLEEKVDGSVSYSAGNIRVIKWTGDNYSIYFKLMPALDY
ncbi:MAG TPA: hypothetical protein DCL21_05515 [Alphaproteobacteria bacterium]|nr:hypothetical protein [Alphaproteobacteria bacterium]